MITPDKIKDLLPKNISDNTEVYYSNIKDITFDVKKEYLIELCTFLKENKNTKMVALSDLSGVDYLDYGKSYWRTTDSTIEGFSRGHKSDLNYELFMKKRFCVSYHLTSYEINFRSRIRVFADLSDMIVPSVVKIWSTADWHEREVYDLFGIIFDGHPNLIRILTDYDFEGHPLRKDFPATGEYEIRYDENKQKIVREASAIKRFINTPKTVRTDFRYK